MSVRAKFYVASLKKSKISSAGEIGTTIELVPVVSGSDENKEFYKYTPTGRIELGTVNEKAAKQFDIGKEYYVDFTEATDEPS